jgi:hypothetical protein
MIGICNEDLDQGYAPLYSILRAVSAHSPDSQFFPIFVSIMSACVRCYGCNKAFTPRGLAQHASKSQNTCCRGSNIPSCYQLVTLPIPHVAHPPGPSQVSTPRDSCNPHSGDEYDLASGQGSDDLSDLDRHSPTGAFITTHVPEQDGDIFPLCITISPFFLQLTMLKILM